MSSLKDFMKNILTERGMFDNQAEEVAERVIAINPDYHWDSAKYPQEVYTAISFVVIQVAKTYIEEKCPEAWFRPIFFT